MQAGGRRRRRSLLLREHRLVPLGLAQALLDVGRCRHHADAADFGKRIDPVEAYGRGLTAPLVDRDRQRRAIEPNLRPRVEPAGRTNQGFPAMTITLKRAEQQHLGLSSIPPAAEEPRGEDPAVIEHQEIARVEIARQLADRRVSDGIRRGIEHQHPGGVALRRRVLGDQLRRQLVVEVRRSQKSRAWSLLAALTRPR